MNCRCGQTAKTFKAPSTYFCSKSIASWTVRFCEGNFLEPERVPSAHASKPSCRIRDEKLRQRSQVIKRKGKPRVRSLRTPLATRLHQSRLRQSLFKGHYGSLR